MKKSSLFCLTALLLAACSNQAGPLAQKPAVTQTAVQPASQPQENVTVIDVGNGKKTSASFSMTVNLKGFDSFKTQSTSGQPAGNTLNMLKVYLLESATGAAPTPGNIASLIKFSKQIARTGVGNHTFVFSNVPANSVAAARYFVGVSALLDVPTGPPPAPYQLNLIATPNAHFDTAGANLVAITNNGGEGGTSGKVYVDANYQISSPTALSTTMTLKNEAGASIDASATVNNGSTTIPGIDAT